jgi:hypothetical protein
MNNKLINIEWEEIKERGRERRRDGGETKIDRMVIEKNRERGQEKEEVRKK